MKRRGVGTGLILIILASFFFWLETVLPTPNPSNDYSIIGFPLGFVGIVVCLISMRMEDKPSLAVQIGRPRYREPVRERIVTERVLVVCPYCGTKNEQGIINCRKCGAEM